MQHQLEITRKTRTSFLNALEGLTHEQLNEIPKGFNNNLIWNFAHLVVTQQLLCYSLAGLTPNVSTEMIQKYRKGTRPNEVTSEAEFEEIKMLAFSLLDIFEEDLTKGIFINYSPYMTSANVELTSTIAAFEFNTMHEGLHFGYALALKKAVLLEHGF